MTTKCEKHVYTMFGKYYEHCIKCGKQHGAVTQWLQDKCKAMEEGKSHNVVHPYIACDAWTSVDYKRYMSSPRKIKTITK